MDAQLETEIDAQFVQRIVGEVTQSCALPFAVPSERIPEVILQAAQWFWENVDMSCEERMYFIPNSAICKGNGMNKIIQLPQQIMSVFGVYKTNEGLRYSTVGDFSMERMMMSSYSMFGGAGTLGGMTPIAGGMGYNLSDIVTALYEVDTFNQTLNPPLSYNFNEYSSKLVILGDLNRSNIVINCYKRCRIQDLYNSYYFFRLCVCFCKRALSTIYGSFEFKLPGGVQINYSNFSDQANDEIEKIKEWVDNNRAADYFFMPNVI